MFKKRLSRIVRIVTGDHADLGDDLFSVEAGWSKLERFVHFWVLVWKSFVRNRCPVRASALSYTTLLALIPTLAVAMSISSIFLKSEGQEQIETFIQEFVSRMIPQQLVTTNAPNDAELQWLFESGATNLSRPGSTATNAAAAPIKDTRVVAAQKEAARYIHGFIQNTYSGTLGAAGVFFLLWVTITTLIRVEETFNDIWGITRGRDWWARITNYFTVLVLGPTLLMAALGMASGPHFQQTKELLSSFPFLETVISQLLPILVISITFALFYKTIPNTKVEFSAALVGGALAGTSWHIFNLISLHFASRAVQTSKIYGSLGLVALVMLGLYAVWVMVLFGAQVAYAFQNREAYLQARLVENVNQRGREFVALRLMTCIGQRFQRGLPPATISQISSELGIPSRLVQQVLQTLLAARLVVEVSRGEPAFAPARPLDGINAHHILMAMRATVGQELVTRDEPVRAEVLGEFARIQDAEKLAASSVTMLALVNRAQARLELTPPPGEDEKPKLVTTLSQPSPGTEHKAAVPRATQSKAKHPVVELDESVPAKTLQSAVEPPSEPTKPTPSEPSVAQTDAAPDTPTAASTTDNESFPL